MIRCGTPHRFCHSIDIKSEELDRADGIPYAPGHLAQTTPRSERFSAHFADLRYSQAGTPHAELLMPLRETVGAVGPVFLSVVVLDVA
jgi:hypothetical protein